jgi:hypothetical protein
MLGAATTMFQNILIRAAGVFKGIRQDWHAVESFFVVDDLG